MGEGTESKRDLHLLEISNWEHMNVLPSCHSYQLTGMETSKPLLGIDRYIFEGRHTDVVGTNLFFSMEDGIPKYYGCGRTKTVFHRVIAVPKVVKEEEELAPKLGVQKPRHSIQMEPVSLNLDAMADADLSTALASSDPPASRK